jgi:hypothetical protein
MLCEVLEMLGEYDRPTFGHCQSVRNADRLRNKKKWMCSIKPCCLRHKMSYSVQEELVGSKNEGVASIADERDVELGLCGR